MLVSVAARRLGLVAASRGYSLSCSAWSSHCGYFFVSFSFFFAVVSLIAERRLQAHGLSTWRLRALEFVGVSSCGAQAQLPRSMWDLPGQ